MPPFYVPIIYVYKPPACPPTVPAAGTISATLKVHLCPPTWHYCSSITGGSAGPLLPICRRASPPLPSSVPLPAVASRCTSELGGSAGLSLPTCCNATYQQYLMQLQWRLRFTGRLKDIDGCKHIHCNNAGVDFVEAVADATLAEAVPRLEPCSSCLPAAAAAAAAAGVLLFSQGILGARPLLSVQCTSFECGGVVVALAWDHRVCDAASIARFTTAWGALARSEVVAPADQPVHDRALFEIAMAGGQREAEGAQGRGKSSRGRTSSLAGSLVAWAKSMWPVAQLVLQLAASLAQPKVLAVQLTFTEEKLKRLKSEAMCSSEDGSVSSSQAKKVSGENVAADHSHHSSELESLCDEAAMVDWVSTDDALSAHLWLAVERARAAPPSNLQTTRRLLCKRAVDLRPRLLPPLPATYFGNAVLGGPDILLTSMTLLRLSAGQVARSMRSRVAAVDAAYVKAQHTFDPNALPPPIMETAGPPGHALILSSWARFDMHSLDFGNGRPALVSPLYGWIPSFLDGTMIIMRSSGDGRVVTAALTSPVSSALRMDATFLGEVQ
eukprot:SM000076S21822  [mRNA]  locus=s76:447729:450536:+ [translate_table: standard]